MSTRSAGTTDESASKQPSLVLTLLSGAIAAAVASPLLWLLLRVQDVELSTAYSLVTASRNFDILTNSVGLMLVVTVCSILLGVPLAVLLTRTDIPAPRLLTIVSALPLVIPSYIGAFAFVATFGPSGELSTVFGINLPQIDGFTGAALIITLYTYPYVFLTTRAALLSMDGSLIDAARTLNATRFQAFRRITIPQIRPAVAAGALLVALYAVSDFGTPAFMDVSVFTSAIYRQWDGGSIEYAALLSLQLIAVAAMVLAIEAGIGRSTDRGGNRSTGNTIRLGRWRHPAAGSVLLLGVITILLPIVIFARWLFQDPVQSVPALEFHWGLAFNSISLAGAAAICAALLAVPVGYAAARSDDRINRLFERITYVGFAVPGVVIGLALVFFGTRYAPVFYRTVPLLVFAYVVRFLPQAVGTVRSATLQIDERLIEAARTLDATRFQAFRKITLPLIVPGIVAGGALVFLTTMKELPATLMLRPFGTDTLVTIVWSAHENLNYRYAAIPALVLVAASGLSMLILLLQEDYGVS